MEARTKKTAAEGEDPKALAQKTVDQLYFYADRHFMKPAPTKSVGCAGFIAFMR
jgi:hypothetical protein